MRDAGVQYSLMEQQHDENIGKFFKRPVLLQELSWNSAFTTTTSNFWNLWVTNKRVSNRLANYKGFRGNLHIKMVVIGNPYYFGRLQISYYPMYGYDGSLVNDTDKLANEDMFKMIESQRQMANLDPSVSTGVEMVFPFVWPTDYVEVKEINSASNAMGRVTFREMTPIQSASGGFLVGTSPSVSIRVYGWVDNLELVGTSMYTDAITPQSGCNDQIEQDQANKGLVSSTLSTASRVAETLASVPGFAPYATPASVAASTAASIAQSLGFSKPGNCTDVTRITPRPVDMMTHLVGADTSVKLSLDPKSGVSVDPEIVGAEGDELSFKNIITKPSYFKTIPWYTYYSSGTHMYRLDVNPCVRIKNIDTIATSAVGGIGNLFSFWYGTMVYRFDVVSTSFHRGRLLLVYDPSGGEASAEEVVQYAAVIDLSEARSFSVSIGYNSLEGMLETGPMNWQNIGGEAPGLAPYNANGSLSLYVANSLTLPTMNADTPDYVEILCYASGGDDLRFARPRAIGPSVTDADLYFPNSGMDTQLLASCDTDCVTKRVLDVKIRDTHSIEPTYAGEHVDSLRALAKRYTHYYTEYRPTEVAVSDDSSYSFAHGLYPSYPGVAYGTSVAVNNNITPISDYNQVGFTFPGYLKMAFVCVRGGMRWKLVPRSSGDTGALSVHRNFKKSGADLFTRRVGLVSTPQDVPRVYAYAEAGSLSGMSITSLSVNNTLEFEVPFQSNFKFHLGRSNDSATHALTTTDSFSIVGSGKDFPICFSMYVAAAEDFTAHHFVGWPPYKIV